MNNKFKKVQRIQNMAMWDSVLTQLLLCYDLTLVSWVSGGLSVILHP